MEKNDDSFPWDMAVLGYVLKRELNVLVGATQIESRCMTHFNDECQNSSPITKANNSPNTQVRKCDYRKYLSESKTLVSNDLG